MQSVTFSRAPQEYAFHALAIKYGIAALTAWRRFELLYLHSIPIISSKLTFEIPTEHEDDEGIERVWHGHPINGPIQMRER